MELSCKSEYVLLALFDLAEHYSTGKPVQLRQIANHRSIPYRYLEQLVATLRRAGLIQSHRGVKGGYSLTRDPSTITLLEVINCIEGLSSQTPTPTDQHPLESVVIRNVWNEVREAAFAVLGRYTLQDLVDRRNISQMASTMYYI